MAETGFAEVAWEDVSTPSLAFFRERLVAAGQGGPPSIGLHLLMGDDFGSMFRNQVRNLEEDRITVIQAVFERR